MGISGDRLYVVNKDMDPAQSLSGANASYTAFRIAGNGGFGFHRTYTPDGEIDASVSVRHGDVFLVPRGYHGPCVAAPGYPMYYLNVMAGPAERAWRVCTDPAHEWLWELFGRLGPDPRCPMTTADGPAAAVSTA